MAGLVEARVDPVSLFLLLKFPQIQVASRVTLNVNGIFSMPK
jgi:hypothetical protein